MTEEAKKILQRKLEIAIENQRRFETSRAYVLALSLNIEEFSQAVPQLHIDWSEFWRQYNTQAYEFEEVMDDKIWADTQQDLINELNY